LLFTIVSAKADLLTIGPDYQQPSNSVPTNYKAVELGNWKEGSVARQCADTKLHCFHLYA